MKSLVTESHRLAMVLFILSEAAFFVVLIASYIYFQAAFTPGPNASNSLHPGTAAIYTAFLIGSSVTMWFAGRSVEHDNARAQVIWLVVTLALGAVFLFGQGREYLTLLGENITLNTNLFGTTFYTLTGFHGLHVFLGLVAIAILAFLGTRGVFRGARSTPVEVLSLYWHFVDVVWIVLFSLIYLWPLLA